MDMKHANERAFLEDIAADPENDTHRLVFADWLEESGDDRFAMTGLMRSQFARLPREPEDPMARIRAAEGWKILLARHGVAAVLPPGGIVRGVPEEAVLTVGDFVRCGRVLFALLPVRRVSITDAGRRIRQLAACPHLAQVAELTLKGTGMTDEAVAALAGSPHVAGLRRLDLRDNPFRSAGARSLIGSHRLSGGLELLIDVRPFAYELRRRLRQRFDLAKER